MEYRRVKPFEFKLIRFLVVCNVYIIGIRRYSNPIKGIKAATKLFRGFQKMIGKKQLARGFKIDGKYLWDLYNPAWPSKSFNHFFANHLHEIEPISDDHISLRRLIVAITKRCPLKCEHCSEKDTLYAQDVLSFEEFTSITDPLVEKGVSQLIYSGGEPLARFDDLIRFIERYKKTCNQWVYTSAFGLTLEKARKLKQAGLNGVAISLDHHLDSEHDSFRGSKESYNWVIKGIENAQSVGIIVALNVCPSKEYVEAGFMEDYILLAKKLNIPMVNIIEPRAVGNYQNKDVEFNDAQKEMLLDISNKYTFDKKYFQSPSVFYPAGYRQVKSCGGGVSYLFLDFDGKFYPCPFCKTVMPKVVKEENLCEAV